MIRLKEFQKDITDKLLKFTSPQYEKNKVVLKAPTGSGKTIMLLSWINDYINSTNDKVAFVWFTPGAGELEQQSQNKASLFSGIEAQSINDALLSGFNSGTATFINYEKVVGKQSKAMLSDSEHENLIDKIEDARTDGVSFILVIDEAHRNDTKKARTIIDSFNAKKIVSVSATIEDPQEEDTEFIEVKEEDVILSGLITKSVVVNEGVDESLDGTDEFAILFKKAEEKRLEMRRCYKEIGINNINPLVLVQLPDDSSSSLLNRIENYLNDSLGKNFDNKKLGIWLSEEKINSSNVEELSNEVEFLIIKQAIATGWDAPRAKILVKIRENMGEEFTIQTLGRIRRMPQPNVGHYNIDALDNSYLYTFDTDFLNGAFKNTSTVVPTPLLSLKDKAKTLSLVSKRIDGYEDEILNEKEIRQNIYEGICRTYGLNDDYEQNKVVFESQGYLLNNEIKTTFKQGRFDTIDNAKNLSERERWIKADYRDNRIDLLHAFHELDRVIHLQVSKVESLLKQLFLWRGHYYSVTILKLEDDEWTAFILNNWKKLRELFRKIDIDQAIQGTLDLNNIFDEEFVIPNSERYKYNPKLPKKEVESNAYEGYTTAIINSRPSNVETSFELWMENNRENISFVYKNGDKGSDYFSLVYSNNGGMSHFYPDYIIKTKADDIYIVETKGGEDNEGNDINIDPYAPAKYEALKKYSDQNNVKWAFVRNIKNALFFKNNGNWTDVVNEDCGWKDIDQLFR